jgi:hypothetical protein
MKVIADSTNPENIITTTSTAFIVVFQNPDHNDVIVFFISVSILTPTLAWG